MTRRPWKDLLLIAAMTTGLSATPPRLDAAEDLLIYFVDVQGGAATLIVTPQRESVLIDTGWPGEHDRDPRRIVQALHDAGCEKIDHLVVTHWHMDHHGGVAGLAKLVEIDRFYDRGLPEDGTGGEFPDGPKPDDPLGIAYRAASRGKRTVLRPGDKLPLKGAVATTVLAASGDLIPAPADAKPNPLCDPEPPDHEPDGSDNARSIALKFQFGAFDFLVCGDLTWNHEKRLVCPVDRVGPIDLFQVTHHGEEISNNPVLLETIAPTVAVMVNGPDKGGLPATVHRYKALKSLQAFYQLHRNAKTRDEDNGDPALFANVDPKGGRYIRVAIPEGGETFTVRLGGAGAERTFQSR